MTGGVGLPLGVERLPADWTTAKLKHIAQVESSNVDKKSHDDEMPVRLCNYTDVYYNDRITRALSFMEATATPREIARFSLHRGDILLTKDSEHWSDIAVPALVVDDLDGVLCGYHLAHVRPNASEVDSGFLFYCFVAEPVNRQLQVVANGVTRFGLPIGELRGAVIPIPPVADQRLIADFLDEKTAAIDALIAKKERLIDLIEEKRQAAITRAVTKGLDPDVPMKDSGVEWIGRCPAEWQVAPIKRYTLVRRGASPRPIDDPKYFDENGRYAWVRIADVTASDGRLRTTTQRLSHLGANLSVKLQPGSLFLSIAGSVGKPCITEIDCCIHDGFVYFPNLDRLEPEYMYFIFAAGEAYRGLGKLGTQLNLNTDTVGSIRVPVPPRDEQLSIVRDLRHQLRTQDELRNRISEQIERLREYRQTLISAAVTGQIDVRSRSTRTDEVLQEALA